MKQLHLLIPKDIPESIRKMFLAVQTWSKGVVSHLPYEIVLARVATDKTSTSATYARCSAPVRWNPSNYPPGKWYLECAIAISSAAGTVYARLYGTNEIAEISLTGTTAMELVTSDELDMPEIPTTIYVEFKRESTGTASFAGARLVFVPD